MRCQAKVAYGSTWEAGRRQCERQAKKGGYKFCAIHLKKHNELLERQQKSSKVLDS
jgi:hypothetical protein